MVDLKTYLAISVVQVKEIIMPILNKPMFTMAETAEEHCLY